MPDEKGRSQPVRRARGVVRVVKDSPGELVAGYNLNRRGLAEPGDARVQNRGLGRRCELQLELDFVVREVLDEVGPPMRANVGFMRIRHPTLPVRVTLVGAMPRSA